VQAVKAALHRIIFTVEANASRLLVQIPNGNLQSLPYLFDNVGFFREIQLQRVEQISTLLLADDDFGVEHGLRKAVGKFGKRRAWHRSASLELRFGTGKQKRLS
jgi:hypothetical protein